MPIKIHSSLPARKILETEGVMVMDEHEAARQDIRPLRIALLNLMPNKIRTETQFARLIGATPLQIELTLIRMSDHESKNTSAEHMLAFYNSWQDIKDQKFDGMIITGAPIELLDFKDVDYWNELTQIFNWTQTNIHSTFAICWGAQAMLNHFHAVPKHELNEKAFGVFQHRNHDPASPYLRGFSDNFGIPVSRWTEIRRDDLPENKNLNMLMDSDVTGPCLIDDPDNNALYMFNHIEYDSTSLSEEYWRDRDTGKEVKLPHGYFPNDNPNEKPENRWRSHAHLLFGNWINQLYQTTPFDIADIGKS